MTEDDLKQFLEDNKSDIQAQVRQKLIEGLLANHSWTMRDQIGECVAAFMKEEIIPEVRAYLASEKSAILEGAIKAASEIGDLLAQELVTKAAKNLKGDSYYFREALAAIFK